VRQRIPAHEGSKIVAGHDLLSSVDNAKRRVVNWIDSLSDPVKRLDRWAPRRWRELCALVRTNVDDFQKPSPVTRLGDVELNPTFEAKCLDFLEPGDLLWVVGS
jgi:hypothetical protein